MPIRPYRPADRARVRDLIPDDRAIDSPRHYVRVAEESGVIAGVALGIVPAAGEEAYLGPVLLRHPGRWDLFHALIASLVEQAIALGFTIGVSDTWSERIVRHLEQTFGLKGRPSGWEPSFPGRTGRPVQWSYRVHLPTFLEQLRALPGGGRAVI